MAGTVPGLLPKTALVGSRAIYYPFTIPKQLNDSATLVGKSLNGMVNGVTASVGQAYVNLEPRGPAKWLLPLFQKTIDATVKSDQIATRNKTAFWDPFSDGVEGVGRAFASPGTYWYLRKAGIEQPTQDQIKGVLEMPLFRFPSADEVPGGEPPASEEPAPAPPPEAPPTEAPAPEAPAPDAAAAAAAAAAAGGTQQAAEGAGEVAAA